MTWRGGKRRALAYVVALPVLWASAVFVGAGLIVSVFGSADSLPWWVLVGLVPFGASFGVVCVIALAAAEQDHTGPGAEAPRVAGLANTFAIWSDAWYRFIFGREYGDALRSVQRPSPAPSSRREDI